MRRTIIILLLTLAFTSGRTQENVTTVGLMLKPVVPSNLFRAGDLDISPTRDNLKIEMNQKLGYSFGMIIRYGLTKNWTFETGLSYVKRNFSLSLQDTDTDYQDELTFGIVGYELPVTALLNIQLGDQIFMNTAFGGVIDFFPSDVEAHNYVDTQTDYFYIWAKRSSWVQFSLGANIGWEYRTKSKGTWYLGGAYHRPFYRMYRALIAYQTNTYLDENFANMSGNYLTIDLRYFFHEDPEKRKTRQQRKKEREQKQKEEEIFYRPGIDGKKE